MKSSGITPITVYDSPPTLTLLLMIPGSDEKRLFHADALKTATGFSSLFSLGKKVLPSAARVPNRDNRFALHRIAGTDLVWPRLSRLSTASSQYAMSLKVLLCSRQSLMSGRDDGPGRLSALA